MTIHDLLTDLGLRWTPVLVPLLTDVQCGVIVASPHATHFFHVDELVYRSVSGEETEILQVLMARGLVLSGDCRGLIRIIDGAHHGDEIEVWELILSEVGDDLLTLARDAR
jgi:hypothetical protein